MQGSFFENISDIFVFFYLTGIRNFAANLFEKKG